MKINRNKQCGATLISWLIVAGIGILMASAVVKVAPYYMEFYNVKKMMKVIASEPGIKKANMRQINSKVEKHLNVNGMYALEKAYIDSRSRKKGAKNPFKIKKLRKGKNRRALIVSYDVPQPWIGNLSFLIHFNHAVILGEPDVKIKLKDDGQISGRKQPKISLQ